MIDWSSRKAQIGKGEIPIKELTPEDLVMLFWEYKPGLSLQKREGNHVHWMITGFNCTQSKLTVHAGGRTMVDGGKIPNGISEGEVKTHAKVAITKQTARFLHACEENGDHRMLQKALLRCARRKKQWGIGRYAGGEPVRRWSSREERRQNQY